MAGVTVACRWTTWSATCATASAPTGPPSAEPLNRSARTAAADRRVIGWVSSLLGARDRQP
jgi:hypothetical protein